MPTWSATKSGVQGSEEVEAGSPDPTEQPGGSGTRVTGESGDNGPDNSVMAGDGSPHSLASEAVRTLALPHSKIRHIFTGRGTPSWKAFARNVLGSNEINGWTDAQALRQLNMNLDGRAADFVEALPASAQTQLEELMRRLNLRFGMRDEEAKAALEACRRQPGEELRDYAEDVRELTKIARPGYTTEVIEELAAEKIQRYLTRMVWWQPDMNCMRLPFNALVERARKCERISSERAQLRGLGRERTIASLSTEEEEEEQELARAVRGREREPPASRDTTPGWVAGIQTGIKGVAGQVTQVGDRVTQVDNKVTQVRTHMTALQTTVETVQTEIGGLARRVARLEAESGQRRTGRERGSGRGDFYGAAALPRTCYLCDRQGHLVRDCPQIARTRNAPGLNANAP
uniref:Uncharacterized protein LOC116948047 n=1 Tax=Petromyzon marinus TaxID=7757 RepID=A0AAJ7TNS5_PETMA|nr:uncharacterized protein LOC116948047 [Petromyzon marinus]XP_032820231.1 uncharacterized protein LOC116948048 [Petromyzon marinus]